MTSKPRILIITAAFGEGHNSAAKNLALALDAAGAETNIADPCLLSAPHSTAVLQWGYRLVTTHFPKIWEKIYKDTDKCDFSRPNLPLMRHPERYLASLIAEFQPAAVVSTYPIYPYFIQRIFNETSRKIPVFTVITDSIEINASWLRAPTDWFLVTDKTTLEIMRSGGIPEKKIINTGFPVNPKFTAMQPISAQDTCKPFRVLYFPTAKKPFVRRHARAILEASPNVQITIVMGKNFRLLQSRARQIRVEYPGRVRLLGWTKKVPQLLEKHHLVVGKAGGATVHEAIAARVPMLIHHLVPGQEEGNLQLLQHINAGDIAEKPADLTEAIANMLADNSAKWRRMKTAIATQAFNDGAITASKFILNHI